MKNLLYLIILTTILASCEQFSKKPVSEFKLQKGSLRNGAHIQLLYAAGGPDKDTSNTSTTGFQYLVREEDTGDTFWILSQDLYGGPIDPSLDTINGYEGAILYVSYSSTNPKDQGILSQVGKMALRGRNTNMSVEKNYKKSSPKIRLPKFVYSNNALAKDWENTGYPAVFGTFKVVWIPKWPPVLYY
jgi:hypothetical protein